MLLWCRSGGGHPGGGQHHRAGDLPAPPAGLALHPVLRLQALQWEKEDEEEEEKEGPQPARLLHIIAAPTLISPARDHFTYPMRPKETKRVQVQHGKKKKKKMIRLWNSGVCFHDSTDWMFQ